MLDSLPIVLEGGAHISCKSMNQTTYFTNNFLINILKEGKEEVTCTRAAEATCDKEEDRTMERTLEQPNHN